MSSLIPERPLIISPSLAATIGLEETLLLGFLADLASVLPATRSREFDWYEADTALLLQRLPFWGIQDIQRTSESLRDKGILLVSSPPLSESSRYRFAFNHAIAATAAANTSAPIAQPAASPAAQRNARTIARAWQPDTATLALLAQQGVPHEFAEQQVPAFVHYWYERGESRHSWGTRFVKHTLLEWRRFESQRQQDQGAPAWQPTNSSQAAPIAPDWRPSDDALDILEQQAGVDPAFIDQSVPEFVLYWREKGDSSNTWNARFINHIRRQWERYQHASENDIDPRPIGAEWQPSPDVFDVLELAHIDLEFARQRIPEFVIYWRDRNESRGSWNTTFIQFIKHEWHNQHRTDATASTRSRRLHDDLTDTSWAD